MIQYLHFDFPVVSFQLLDAMRVSYINQCLLHHVLTAIFWAPTVACLVLVASVSLAEIQ